MSDFYQKYLTLNSLEASAQRPGWIHDFHPGLKILMVLSFTICVTSCGPDKILYLPPFILGLILIHFMAKIPLGLFWRRLLIALPFGLFAGIWGCFIDLTPVSIGHIHTTGGILSLVSILLRTCLSVGILLILVGTTPIQEIGKGLRQLHCPREITLVFELICRYLGVLIDEANALKTAYQLRGGSKRGIALKHFGSLAGGLLIRSFHRASQIYHAMICRGYPSEHHNHQRLPFLYEWLFAFVFIITCIFFRFIFCPVNLILP